MKKMLKMENLGCANCASKMEMEIAKLPGVSSAAISFMTQKLILDVRDGEFDSVVAQAQKICKRIEPDCSILIA